MPEPELAGEPVVFPLDVRFALDPEKI